jgi:DNA polymerase-1
LEDVTVEQRQLGKRINFSIIYGLTPYGLSKDLKISFKDAKKYIEKYFEQYPGISTWMDKIIDFTKEKGFVETLWGRRRYIPGIYEKNQTLYDLARRIAINTVVQGTAAEIMKLGMINLDKAIEKNNLDAQIILQIHDELLINTKKEEKEKVEQVVKESLENVVDWNVSLIITTRFGENWKEVTK